MDLKRAKDLLILKWRDFRTEIQKGSYSVKGSYSRKCLVIQMVTSRDFRRVTD